MAQEPNKLLRLIVPLILMVAGIGIAVAVFRNTGTPATPKPGDAAQTAATPAAQPATKPSETPASTPGGQTPTNAPSPAPAPAPSTPSTTTPTPAPTTPVAGTPPVATTLTAREYDFESYAPIGSLKKKADGGTYEMQIEFAPQGAGIRHLALANHFNNIQLSQNEVIQQFLPMPAAVTNDPLLGLTPLAGDKIQIDGKDVALWKASDPKKTFWKQTAPGAFEAEIVDGDGKPVVRVVRTYDLKANVYDVEINQQVINLTDRPLKISWRQFGPGSLPAGTIRYGGDVRRVRFGYLLPAAKDPSRQALADDRSASLIPYQTALHTPSGTFPGTFLPRYNAEPMWPNKDSTQNELELAWAGTTSRYFTAAVFPKVGTDKAFSIIQSVDRLAIPTGESTEYGFMDWLMGRERKPVGELVLRMSTPEMTVEPGKSADLSMTFYAGPSSRPIMDDQPGALWIDLKKSVLYTFGGPCGFCTFQSFAWGLRWFLGLLHDYVTGDWAIAIILLVVCMRTLLHPLTKWSQKSMYRFSKDLGKLAPKQKAIQERYKDDPAKLREELGRLMREEGINYSGALGCLPALLQTPIWIALSAMIFFTFELRHSHAFYGVFQGLTGHKWGFLGDLSEPDHLISFGRSFGIPILSGFMGPIDGLNILPLLMGLVFYVQQKYLTPPPTTPLTPEQEQQMKITRVMMVVLFPLMMYNAPAGLALYFATNSTLGIVESKWIRAQAEREEKEREAKEAADRAAGIYKKKAEPKKEGFFARLQRMAEEAQKQRDVNSKNRGKK